MPGQTQVPRVHRHPQHRTVRGTLPQFVRSDIARLERLSPPVIVFQTPIHTDDRISLVLSCALEIRIQFVNEVSGCHQMSFGWVPVSTIWSSFVVPSSPSTYPSYFLSQVGYVG
jgi:hypothetical protein